MESTAVNILVVDDREENLAALNAVLSSPEYCLVNATSGRQALDFVSERDFAVILLDVQMPGMDGLEATRRIRRLSRSQNTPIILVTGMFPDEEHIRLGYEVGAVDFISKPFDPRVMKSKVAVFVDLFRKTEKIRLQEKLLHEASENRFRTLFEQSSLAIQLFSPKGEAVEVNRAWERLLGASESEFVQASGSVLAALAGQSSELPPMQWGDKWIESFIHPVRNESGAIQEVAVILKDVTDRMEVEDKLRRSRDELLEQREKLQQAVQARDEFISIAGHELKTPVTSLGLHAEMAALQLKREQPLDELRRQMNKFVAISYSQTERLSRLIEEMLDVSRLGAGSKLKMERERFDLTSLVRRVLEDFSEQLRHVASFNLEPGAWVDGDRYRIEQVVTNLLTNAMKYGAGQPIRVRVEKHPEEVRLVVEDRGIGISAEHQKRIFERFERAVPSTSFAGLGLGLYIVKKIVEEHRGAVAVESELGRGSTFTVILPASRAS